MRKFTLAATKLARFIFRLNDLPFGARKAGFWGDTPPMQVKIEQMARLVAGTRVHGSEEKRFLERHVRPGMQVVDIGANQGPYTLLIVGMLGGHVAAQELRRSLRFERRALQDCIGASIWGHETLSFPGDFG